MNAPIFLCQYATLMRYLTFHQLTPQVGTFRHEASLATEILGQMLPPGSTPIPSIGRRFLRAVRPARIIRPAASSLPGFVGKSYWKIGYK
jgi:hypothetical protein